MHNDEFTLRQTMNHRFYEYHHYLDQLPPEVEFHVLPEEAAVGRVVEDKMI